DASVLGQNNIAQRNLDVVLSPLPSRSGPVSAYAIVHNGALVPRDIIITCEVGKASRRAVEQVALEVIDGQGHHSLKPKPVEVRDTVTLERMQPCENRWIGLSLGTSSGRVGERLPVALYEMAGKKVVNGVTIAVQLALLDTIILKNLRNHGMGFRRLATSFYIESAA